MFGSVHLPPQPVLKRSHARRRPAGWAPWHARRAAASCRRRQRASSAWLWATPYWCALGLSNTRAAGFAFRRGQSRLWGLGRLEACARATARASSFSAGLAAPVTTLQLRAITPRCSAGALPQRAGRAAAGAGVLHRAGRGRRREHAGHFQGGATGRGGGAALGVRGCAPRPPQGVAWRCMAPHGGLRRLACGCMHCEGLQLPSRTLRLLAAGSRSIKCPTTCVTQGQPATDFGS